MSDFERRHYEAVAEVLAACRPHDTLSAEYGLWHKIVVRFSNNFAATNGRFRPGLFMDACKKEHVY